MGYWMHVYSRTDKVMECKAVEELFKEADVVLELFGRRGTRWSEISLTHPDEWPITLINVVRGKQVAQRIADACESVLETPPPQNAEWVVDFLQGVKVVYVFDILSGVDKDDGWDYVHALQGYLRAKYDSILYAEMEGYSNRNGDHITWEFSQNVTGECQMALYDARSDTWQRFRMELSDHAAREAFRAGRVPDQP